MSVKKNLNVILGLRLIYSTPNFYIYSLLKLAIRLICYKNIQIRKLYKFENFMFYGIVNFKFLCKRLEPTLEYLKIINLKFGTRTPHTFVSQRK